MDHLTKRLSLGVIQVPIILGLLFLALVIPITARLVQNGNTDTRSKADYPCLTDGSGCGGLNDPCSQCCHSYHGTSGSQVCGPVPTGNSQCSPGAFSCFQNNSYQCNSNGYWPTTPSEVCASNVCNNGHCVASCTADGAACGGLSSACSQCCHSYHGTLGNQTCGPALTLAPTIQPTPTQSACILNGQLCGGVNGSCDNCCSKMRNYLNGGYYCVGSRLPTAAPRSWKFSDATIYLKKLLKIFTIQAAYAVSGELNDQGTCNYSYGGSWYSWDCDALSKVGYQCGGAGGYCAVQDTVCTTSTGGYGICKANSCCAITSGGCPGKCMGSQAECFLSYGNLANPAPGVVFPAGNSSCGTGSNVCCVGGEAPVPTPTTPIVAQKVAYSCVCPDKGKFIFSTCKWVKSSDVPQGVLTENLICSIQNINPPADCYGPGECGSSGTCGQCCDGKTYVSTTDQHLYCGTLPAGASSCSTNGTYTCTEGSAYKCENNNWKFVESCNGLCHVTSSYGYGCINSGVGVTVSTSVQNCLGNCSGIPEGSGRDACIQNCTSVVPTGQPTSYTDCITKNGCSSMTDYNEKQDCVNNCATVFPQATATPRVTSTPIPSVINSSSCDVKCRAATYPVLGRVYDECMANCVPVPTAVPGVCDYTKEYCSSYVMNGKCQGYCVPVPTAGPSPQPTSMPTNGQCKTGTYCTTYVGASGCMGYCVPVVLTPTRIPVAVVVTGTVVQPTSAPAPSGAPNPGPGPNPGTGSSCTYSNLQARVQDISTHPLVTNITIQQGAQAGITCTHDNTGTLANNVKLVAIHNTNSANNKTWSQNNENGWIPAAGIYTIYCESTDSHCTGLRSDSAQVVVNGAAVGGNCKQCMNNFQCYGNAQFGYKWFVPGYEMDGFGLSVDQYCIDAGIPKPTWKGKAAGDANCDGVINGADLSIWRREYVDVSAGQAVSRNTWEADFTGSNGLCDGVVNGADYSLWHRSYTDLGGGR